MPPSNLEVKNLAQHETTIVMPLPYWVAIAIGVLLLIAIIILILTLIRCRRRRESKHKDANTNTDTAQRAEAGTGNDGLHPPTSQPPPYSDIFNRVYENIGTSKPLPALPMDSKEEMKYGNPAFSTISSDDEGSSIYDKPKPSKLPDEKPKLENVPAVKPLPRTNSEGPVKESQKTKATPKQYPKESSSSRNNNKKTVLNKPHSKHTPVYDIPTSQPVTGGKENLLVGNANSSVSSLGTSTVLSSMTAVAYSKPLEGKQSLLVPSSNIKISNKKEPASNAGGTKPKASAMQKDGHINSRELPYKAPVYSKVNKGRMRNASTRSDEVPLFAERKGSIGSLAAAFEGRIDEDNHSPRNLDQRSQSSSHNVENRKNELLSLSRK